jgi:predicted nucleic acid-binding protein
VTLADSSAWIEYLRGTGSPVALRFDAVFDADELMTTEPVVMELLAGIGSNGDERRIRGMLSTATLLPVRNLAPWETAAAISRVCRDAGDTIAGRLDCLVAAVALRDGVEVLHADRDFDRIADHTPLRIAAV